MSLNDPHLEAQMELESRRPLGQQRESADFRRKQLWVVVGAIAAVLLGWLAYVLVR